MLELFISVLLPDRTNWLSLAEQLVEPDVVYTRSSWVSIPIFLTCITSKALMPFVLLAVRSGTRILISDARRLRKPKGKKLIIKK